VLVFAVMVTLFVVGVHVELVLKVPVDPLLVLKMMVVAEVSTDGLPNWSWVWTVMMDEQTPAVRV